MSYREYITNEIVKIEGASLLLAKKTYNIAEIEKLAKKGYVPAIETAIEIKAKNGEDYTELKDLFKNTVPDDFLKEGIKLLNEKIEEVEPQIVKRKRLKI